MSFYSRIPGFLINTTEGNASTPTMHYHGTFDLYYIESGKREYFVEDKFFTASTGEFVLIKSSSFHRIGHGYVLRTLVSFTEDFLANTYSPSVICKLVACFENPLICPTEEQRQVLRPLLTALQKNSDETQLAITLGQLLLALSQCTQNPVYDTQISNIIKYINTNFSDIQSIDQIAAHMNISKQHLCRLFKHSTGMTLTQYINKIRIKNSCVLLVRSDKSLSEICHLCGFHSSAYFSTVFKNITGLSPIKYRQENK